MQSATDKPDAKGFTRVPNAVIDSKVLTSNDKLVIIVLARHAYGDKKDVWPSQVCIAAKAGIGRKSVRASLKRLTAFGIAEEVRKDCRGQATYRLHLERAAQVPGTKRPDKTADLGRAAHQAYSIDKTKKADASRSPDVPSNTVGTGEPGTMSSVLQGNAMLYERPGPDNPGPQREQIDSGLPTFNKHQINELLLTPSGNLPDTEGLESDLCFVLGMAKSPSMFNYRELEKLSEVHGPQFCAFWAAWLLRKIAAEYEAGRPVARPAGLYAEAVRGHWEVDPSWPEFDESKHTAAIPTPDADYSEIPF